MSSNNLIDFNQLSRYNDKVKSKFETKVDKIEGKGLSTNDYTNEEKEKLEKLENYNDSALSERVSTIEEDYLTSTDKTTLSEKIDLKANLESPILTGTPSAPTAAAGTNTEQIATTSFVQTAKQEAIKTVLGETIDTDFDTLQEVANWIQADTTASAELITRVTDAEMDIENLQTDLAKKYDSTATREANTFLAGPDGNAGGGTFRKIVADDLPTVPIAKGGTGATTALGAQYNLLNGMVEVVGDMTDDTQITGTYVSPSTTKGHLFWVKASAFWTYIKGKFTGAVSNIITSNLTASRALVSDANGKVTVSAVTSTELGYLDGVTSAIQTQLNNKVTAVSGKGLSTNDYTTTEKTKLSSVETGATKTTVSFDKTNHALLINP